MTSMARLLDGYTVPQAAEILNVSERHWHRIKKGECVNCGVIAMAITKLDAVDYAQEHLSTVCPIYQALQNKKTALH